MLTTVRRAWGVLAGLLAPDPKRTRTRSDPFRNRAKLQVERLEDRTVPATFIVKNLNPMGVDSFKAAFNSANADTGTDEVISFQLQQGVSGTIQLPQWASGTIQKNMTITGPGADIVTLTRDPNGLPGRIFTIPEGKTVSITGLTLAGGNVSEGSGGAINNAGNLSLSGVNLYGNHAGEFGGAIANYGTETLDHVFIWMNSAKNGGGIANFGTTYVNYDSHIFSNSSQFDGGGIYNNSTVPANPATLVISDSSQIYGNAAGRNGGGIYNTGSAAMTGGLLEANTASGNGGGLYNASGTSSITGVSLKRNGAVKGGGVYAALGTITLENDAVQDNMATLGSGGCWVDGVSKITTTNCTIINQSFVKDA